MTRSNYEIYRINHPRHANDLYRFWLAYEWADFLTEKNECYQEETSVHKTVPLTYYEWRSKVHAQYAEEFNTWLNERFDTWLNERKVRKMTTIRLHTLTPDSVGILVQSRDVEGEE